MSVIWVGRERLCFLLFGAVEASGGKKVDLALYWRPLVAPLPLEMQINVRVPRYITSLLSRKSCQGR